MEIKAIKVKISFYYVFIFLLMIKKFPVDFNLYSLPSLPQDDRFLVWILKTNTSLDLRPSILTTSYCLFVAADDIKAEMRTKWQ